jgi:hypothetical protein
MIQIFYLFQTYVAACASCCKCFMSRREKQAHALQETDDLPGAFYRAPGKGILCRVLDPAAPGKPALAEWRALGKVQPSAKIGLCQVSGTRQSQAVDKGGRRDGGHLPSSFAECSTVRDSAKHFFIFFNFFARCPWPDTRQRLLCRVPRLAPGKLYIFFVFLPHFLWSLATVNKSLF